MKFLLTSYQLKNTKRPAFKACLNYLREDDTLEVLSLDRLSRNYQDIKQIVSQLRNKKDSISY
ncbi:recombinase family protein [Oenococcus oeni]